MDTVGRETRSRIMRSVRSKWTRQESWAHRVLAENGIAHEMHPRVPGNPDILIEGKSIAIFLDGCFWHGCPRHYREPKSNRGYWLPKIERNRRRDRTQRWRAWKAGYRTRRIWECRLSSASLLAAAGAR